MRMSRTCALMMVFLVGGVVAGTGPTPCDGKTLELTYNTMFPPTHAVTLESAEWGKEIERRTNGAVKIHIFPAASLTAPDMIYDGVVKGISDIGCAAVSYSKGRFPVMEVVDLPLGYKSAAQSTGLINAVYEKFKPKECADVKVLYFAAYGPGMFHTSRKPVRNMEDLKGMKIRGSGTSVLLADALGATGVAMPQNDTYDALQKGIVDGALFPCESLKLWKMAEVTTSTTKNYGSAYTVGMFYVMNKKKWNSLPVEVQGEIEKVNKEFIIKTGQMWDRINKEGLEYAMSRGVHQLIELTPEEDARWAKVVRPLLDNYANTMKSKGLPGKEILDFCLEWLQKNP